MLLIYFNSFYSKINRIILLYPAIILTIVVSCKINFNFESSFIKFKNKQNHLRLFALVHEKGEQGTRGVPVAHRPCEAGKLCLSAGDVALQL